jgi:hypothetical protein
MDLRASKELLLSGALDQIQAACWIEGIEPTSSLKSRRELEPD